MAALIAVAWSGFFTLLIALAIKYTLGWRITEEAEVEGIDFDQHGETAYDLHTGLGGSGTPGSILAGSTAPSTQGAHA